MPQHTSLIATLVAAICLAFVLGALAHRLRLSPLVGYLLAGVVIGPFTPGYVADQALAAQLAEIGVILLMFGVGLHISVSELLAVWATALPGALAQLVIGTVLGVLFALSVGWSVGAGLVLGLALSVASTVVVLRTLQGRRLLESELGRVTVGWLIVEDLAMILALVLLPAVSGLLGGRSGAEFHTDLFFGPLNNRNFGLLLALTLAKFAVFAGLMLLVGRRLIPWVLHFTAHTGSRELFRLAVLAIALGVAFGAAQLFDVSFALGAFFAGMILAESELSQRAAQETLPLRDAFAVLFFVSVGMLVDPMILIREPHLVAAVLIAVIGSPLAALAVVLVFRYPLSSALTIAVSLAQIGEFSFILSGLGATLGILTKTGRDLVLAAAILSILLNPLLFAMLDQAAPLLRAREQRRAGTPASSMSPSGQEIASTKLSGHAVLVGFGRVGSLIGPPCAIAIYRSSSLTIAARQWGT
jgi:CPA2 family monovalent cation:H+ antiporter-2